MQLPAISTVRTENASYQTDAPGTDEIISGRPPSKQKVASKQILERKAYSLDEVATVIGVCRETIYAWVRAGRLKARKFGRKTIVLASDLDDVLEKLPQMHEAPWPMPQQRGRPTEAA